MSPARQRRVVLELQQRREDERALVHAGMRHHQVRRIDRSLAEHEQIDVDRARAPVHVAHAMELAFDGGASRQQVGGSRSVSTSTTAFRKSGCGGPTGSVS